MARRRGSSRFIRPSPKTKMWIGGGVGLTVITASSEVAVAALSAGALLLRPFTILRTRLLIAFGSDQAAAGESPEGTYGEIVVTDSAAAIGTTAIPDPSSTDGNPEADWYVVQECVSRFDFLSSVGFQSNGIQQYIVDSKAMRKVGPDDDVVSKFSETGGFGARLWVRGRQLIQLH